MPTHVTHGGTVSTFPDQGQGQGHGTPPPFAQIPTVGVTADNTVWTADTVCVTADGRVICIPAYVAEAASAVEGFDAEVVAGGAVISADVLEAADASDTADAIGVFAADTIEGASALDVIDAVTDVAADAIEAATAIDELDAAVGANVLFGTVDEPAGALDQLDADVDAEAGGIVDGGGAFYPPLQRPLPVYGIGYGILPQLVGEAHGVVAVAGDGVGALPDVAAEVAASVGVAGRSEAKLLRVRAAAIGACGTRGSGEGVIVKFSGTATGRHDDDEAAVIAFLLAA